ALEKRMFFDVQDNVEIPGGASMRAGLAQPRKSNSGSVLDAGWDFCIHRLLAEHAAFPFALGARVSDHAACALARGTCAGHAEESLLVADLAAASARAAGDGSFPCGCPRTVAFFAGLVAAHGDCSFCTEDGFLELERDVLAQIRAALGTAATPKA